MKLGLAAAAATATLVIVGAVGYLVGESSAPTAADARDAEQAAYDEAFEASEEEAAAQAREVALKNGRRGGRQAGSDDGASDADAEIAASQPAAGTVDEFGIPRPAPGVSPEYDICIAQGGTPSPDGCLF